MKRFLIRTFAFIAVLIILDRIFILFRESDQNMFGEIAVQKMKKISYKIDKSGTDDILIVGSSHGQFGVSPEIISNLLNKTSFNLSYGGGSNLGLQITLLKKLLLETAYKPKTIVFTIDVFTLNASPVFNDPVQNYFFKNSETISQKIKHNIYSCFKMYGKNIPGYVAGIKKGSFTLPYFKKHNII